MTKVRFTVNILALAALTLFAFSAAQAQATRTWVSGTGNDANPCSRTAPCSTFSGAISKTAAGGEIDALDPGGFGTVSITKSMTIDGNGTHASILASGTAGVTVNDSLSGTPNTAKVYLRNLSINGSGTTLGTNGVNFIAGNAVVVENCVIFDFATTGIRVNLTTAGHLKVINTTIENITTDGINATTSSVSQLLVTIENTRVMNNGEGMEFGSNVRAAINNSIVTHNTTTGIKTTGTNSILNLDDVTVSYSATSLQASAGSTINVSDSIISQAVTGLSPNGGTINSFQGNSLINAPGAFSGPATGKQ